MRQNNDQKFLWSEMFPYEFREKLQACPVAYLPLGLCEPHGHISAFGLDTYKAEYICEETASQSGGIVAPTMAYHIHEIGSSARWLEEQVGNTNPRLTSIPSFVFFRIFLYQLRAMYNAGFRSAIVLSGHGGAHPQDIHFVCQQFMKKTPFHIWFGTDFDLVKDQFPADHAGKYEISALMYIRPDLIDHTLYDEDQNSERGGHFALHPSAKEASVEYGKAIVEGCVNALGNITDSLKEAGGTSDDQQFLTYQETEALWENIVQAKYHWVTLHPREGQPAVSADSRWKSCEYTRFYR